MFTVCPAMEAQQGENCSSFLSLASALDGGGWLVPHPGCFSPGNNPVPVCKLTGKI